VRAALQSKTGASRVLRHLAERGASGDVRRAAIECLGLAGEPSSVVAVLRGTETPETSAAAGEALDHFGSDAVPHALAASSSMGPDAIAALLRWALARAQPSDHRGLVQIAWRALEASDAGVAPWDVVASLGNAEDGEKLIARLEAAASRVDATELSRPLVTLIARFPELTGRLADLAPLTTRLGLLIAAIVASAGHPVPIEPLREALTAPDPAVRAAAVRALGAVGDHSAARDALEFALADEDPGVQAAAAEALGSVGAGTDMLEQSLRAAEPRVRRAAARALARRGGNVRGPLLQALDDPDPAVVLAALEGLGENATVEDITTLTTHRDPDVAAEALVRLRARDATAAAKAALGMLDHPVWAVRLEAVRSVDASGAGAEALRRRAERERDPMVLEAIESVLGGKGGATPA
jgi:HEAT repeat protein